MRQTSPNKYIMELASLPYLPHPDVAYKLPIYEHQIHKNLATVAVGDLQFIERLSDFCLEENAEPLDDYIKNIQWIYEELDSKVMLAMVSEILAMHLIFRSLSAKQHNKKLSIEALEPYPLIANYFDQLKMSKTYRALGSQLCRGMYFEIYLLLLKKLWEIVDKYHCHQVFNREGLFIYQFKWRILSAWIKCHDKDAVRDKLQELVGEHNDEN